MISGLAVVLFTAVTYFFPELLGPMFEGLRNTLTSNLDWFFILAANLFVVLCIVLVAVAAGQRSVWAVPTRHQISALTGWFAMLFAAGMGIGLMFYGVSEPLEPFRRDPWRACHRERRAHRLGAA